MQQQCAIQRYITSHTFSLAFFIILLYGYPAGCRCRLRHFSDLHYFFSFPFIKKKKTARKKPPQQIYSQHNNKKCTVSFWDGNNALLLGFESINLIYATSLGSRRKKTTNLIVFLIFFKKLFTSAGRRRKSAPRGE